MYSPHPNAPVSNFRCLRSDWHRGAERLEQRGIFELKTESFRGGRERPLAGKQHAGHLAESQSNGEGRGAQPGWSSHHLSEGPAKVLHPFRMRSGDIECTLRIGILNQKHDETDFIVEMNPRHPLVA